MDGSFVAAAGPSDELLHAALTDSVAARPAARAESAASRSEALRAEILADLNTQLMLQYRQGDVEAGTRLARNLFPTVVRYLGRMVRDAAVLEDLAQDVFVRVFAAAHEFRPSGKVSTWVYTIATNVALTHRRRTRTRPPAIQTEAESAENTAGRRQAEPGDELERMELSERVVAAIDALAPNQRAALTLLRFEGLSCDEIAAVLGVSVEAVKSLLARARDTLRKSLDALDQRE